MTAVTAGPQNPPMPAPANTDERARRKREFTDASDDLLAYGITLTQIADAFGLAQNTVARWRMPTDRLQPPADWKAKIAVAYDAAAERAEAEGARLRSVAAEYRRTTSATG